ncbi:hypothetical protein ACTJJN_13085 [Pseudomonas sp. 22515]|uniref:hypothetical protein n=1 Tax=Pseudomonas sp. 22515 TaxID=3453934 RepID=UPI003F8367DB
MRWKNLQINGRELCMAHLQPTVRTYQLPVCDVSVEFTFGFHCFTDNKENGPLLRHPRTNEERYFCATRYDQSKQLLEFIDKRFIDAKVRTHFGGVNNSRYFCLDTHEYAIFFEIRKPANQDNFLRLNVVSAYEVDQWGRSSMPSKGSLLNVRYVLEKRNLGIKI